MKPFKQALRYGSAPLALVLGGAAHAEVPTEVTTAITGLGTDLTTVATAIIVAMLAFWGLRKLARKFGWF